jgi:hypothetical protein
MRRWSTAAPILLALLVAGCGPQLVVEPVHTTGQVRVLLRRTLDGEEPVARGYDHPVTIADTRVAHILASLNFETSKGKRQPVIRTAHLYELAEGLAKAFEQAGPDDEIAAAAFARDPRFGIFTEDRVTSFRAWFEGGQLRLEFFAVEKPLEEPGVANESRSYRIPSATPHGEPRFRMISGRGIALDGDRSVLVDWRDPGFRKPVEIRIGASGIQRRTTLMEAEEESPPVALPPRAVTDAQIRALDQLDAGRRSGLVTEGEFQRRRRLILEGRLEEAGYESKPQ